MRQFNEYSRNNPKIKRLLEILADKQTDIATYRDSFERLGVELGHALHKDIEKKSLDTSMLVCSSEDADWLAKGVLKGVGRQNMPISVFWTTRRTLPNGVDITPVIKTYQDNISDSHRNLIVVKSIISSACVVKTQLLALIRSVRPKNIYILAPVMFKGAKSNLESEFPENISSKFKYIYFAEDDQKKNKEIIPGIGGMVYPRLGLGDENDKNRYFPKIVKERMKLDEPFIKIPFSELEERAAMARYISRRRAKIRKRRGNRLNKSDSSRLISDLKESSCFRETLFKKPTAKKISACKLTSHQ